MKMTTTVDTLIVVYSNIIEEYLKHIYQSEFIKTIPNSKYILCVGLNVVIHIFNVTLSKTKNLNYAITCCQTGYYCYLEYIEQMNKTESLHNLNNKDAVLFVYRKAMENENTQTTSNFQNITENVLETNDKNENGEEKYALLLSIISNMSAITHFILSSNSLEYTLHPKKQLDNSQQQQNIQNDLIQQNDHDQNIQHMIEKTVDILPKYLKLMSNMKTIEENKKLNEVISFANKVFEKMNLHHRITYCLSLELLKKIKKMKTENKYPDKIQLDNAYLKFILMHDSIMLNVNRYIDNKKYKQAVDIIFDFS